MAPGVVLKGRGGRARGISPSCSRAWGFVFDGVRRFPPRRRRHTRRRGGTPDHPVKSDTFGSALEGLAEAHLAALEPGEALVWAQRSTDKRFTQRPVKVVMRPRFTQHGGGTKTAVSGRTVR